MKQLRRLLFPILFLTTIAHAEVKVPAIFGDHMVLQRGVKVPIWGTADAKENVTIKAAGQEKSAIAGDDGSWRVTLDPLESADPFEVTIAGAKSSITIKDVLIGEVWLCSGQSNMGFTLKAASNGAEAIAAANRPKIRLFMVGRKLPDKPQKDLEGKWEVCSRENVGGFSAVAYFFGTTLQEKLNQPIGLIQSSWGGTRAEAWMPRETFDALNLPYEPAWTQEWLHPTSQPGKKLEPERPHEAPAILYNGMIAPIATYAIRGAIWYQGETNTAYGEHYARVLGALIKSWRDVWQQGDFPFLVVQLPNFKNNRFWPITRQAQAEVAQQLPNVGLVVTIDVGNPTNIHPTNKLPVGQRLAACAQKIAYGQDIPFTGPTFASMKIEGDRAIVKFDHLEGGLTNKGDKVEGFEIAGPDGKFIAADAKIDGDTVILCAQGVDSPNAVRYGWQNDPTCTLYNKAGFPAAPFEAK